MLKRRCESARLVSEDERHQCRRRRDDGQCTRIDSIACQYSTVIIVAKGSGHNCTNCRRNRCVEDVRRSARRRGGEQGVWKIGCNSGTSRREKRRDFCRILGDGGNIAKWVKPDRWYFFVIDTVTVEDAGQCLTRHSSVCMAYLKIE